MKDRQSVVIECVANGFVVRPRISAGEVSYLEESYVFEKDETMFKFLREHFAPEKKAAR